MSIFKAANSDLNNSTEIWKQCSVEEMKKRISKEYRLPYKAIRELTVPIIATNTLEDVRRVAKEIEKMYNIACFQFSIDRKENQAHLLFNFMNRENGLTYYFNSSDQKLMCAMAKIILGHSDDKEIGKRYYLLNYYKKDQNVFKKLQEALQHRSFSQKSFRILKDALDYIENVCEGNAK